MITPWPEIGGTIKLLKAQDADLALAHELMRGRARLEQQFIDGLRSLIEKNKSKSEEENRDYSKILITAFEEELDTRSDLNLDLPEYPVKEELSVGSELAQMHFEAHMAHEEKYAKLLASKDELKRWLNSPRPPQMPLIELEYRLTVPPQQQSARRLREWYETELLLLIETHHSNLEDTKATMLNTTNAIIHFASACNRIYSRALGRASELLPLGHRTSIQENLDLELDSKLLVPVDYLNWFFDGQPSPLHFGIGTLPIDISRIPWFRQAQTSGVKVPHASLYSQYIYESGCSCPLCQEPLATLRSPRDLCHIHPEQFRDLMRHDYDYTKSIGKTKLIRKTVTTQHYHQLNVLFLLEAERRSDLKSIHFGDDILFELVQYGPLLPIKRTRPRILPQEFLPPKPFARIVDFNPFHGEISRSDLISLLSPDQPIWEPLGSARRKELLKMAIGKVDPYWLTLDAWPNFIVDVIQQKWDFETDKPK